MPKYLSIDSKHLIYDKMFKQNNYRFNNKCEKTDQTFDHNIGRNSDSQSFQPNLGFHSMTQPIDRNFGLIQSTVGHNSDANSQSVNQSLNSDCETGSQSVAENNCLNYDLFPFNRNSVFNPITKSIDESFGPNHGSTQPNVQQISNSVPINDNLNSNCKTSSQSKKENVDMNSGFHSFNKNHGFLSLIKRPIDPNFSANQGSTQPKVKRPSTSCIISTPINHRLKSNCGTNYQSINKSVGIGSDSQSFNRNIGIQAMKQPINLGINYGSTQPTVRLCSSSATNSQPIKENFRSKCGNISHPMNESIGLNLGLQSINRNLEFQSMTQPIDRNLGSFQSSTQPKVENYSNFNSSSQQININIEINSHFNSQMINKNNNYNSGFNFDNKSNETNDNGFGSKYNIQSKQLNSGSQIIGLKKKNRLSLLSGQTRGHSSALPAIHKMQNMGNRKMVRHEDNKLNTNTNFSTDMLNKHSVKKIKSNSILLSGQKRGNSSSKSKLPKIPYMVSGKVVRPQDINERDANLVSDIFNQICND